MKTRHHPVEKGIHEPGFCCNGAQWSQFTLSSDVAKLDVTHFKDLTGLCRIFILENLLSLNKHNRLRFISGEEGGGRGRTTGIPLLASVESESISVQLEIRSAAAT